MTMQGNPTDAGGASVPGGQAPAPPMYYWTSRGMDKFRGAAIKRLLQGIDRRVDEWATLLQKRQDGLGLKREPDPSKRVMAYYNKPDTYEEATMLVEAGMIKVPYSWESQKAYFPNDWAEDWTDFNRLRIRANKGDFGPMIQAQEVAYTSGENQDTPLDSELMQQNNPNPAGLASGPGQAPTPPNPWELTPLPITKSSRSAPGNIGVSPNVLG